jgi:hypothetical protein
VQGSLGASAGLTDLQFLELCAYGVPVWTGTSLIFMEYENKACLG